MLDAYNHELLNRDMAGEIAGLVVTAERARTIDLGDKILLREVEVPFRFVGKQLKDLDLRRQFEVQVVLVRRSVIKNSKVSVKRKIPGPEFILERGDMILLLGTPEGLDRIG